MEQSPVDNLSHLERLPVELIQEIFFYALEINMTYASRYLWRVLSTQPILQALTILAYFDDDGQSPVETRYFLPAEYRLLSLEEKVHLQQMVLAQSWCNRQHLAVCRVKLARLVMAQAWHREDALEKEIHQAASAGQNLTINVENEWHRLFAALPEKEDESELKHHFILPVWVEQTGSSRTLDMQSNFYEQRLLRIVTWTYTSHNDGTYLKHTNGDLSIMAVRHIPSWLLRSRPWTLERLNLLQLLRQSFIVLPDDFVMSISAKAVFDGITNALEERNVLALTILLEIHSSFFKAAAWNFRRMMGVQLTPPSHHPLPLELFHLAIKQGDSAADLLWLLLRAGIDSLPRDDEPVTSWALQESTRSSATARDIAIASWLLKYMAGDWDFRLPLNRGYAFTDGALSWRVGNRENMPFSDLSFAEELSYLRGLNITPAGLNGTVCGDD